MRKELTWEAVQGMSFREKGRDQTIRVKQSLFCWGKEFSFYVEAGAVFCKESVSSEDNEQIWILFSYYKNEEEGEGIHATSSYSSMGFA